MDTDTTSHDSGPVLRTSGLTRTFTRGKQTVEAVQGLDLEIGQGELVAFLGPNGAGKSTTLRMLTTLIAPTSGSASVAGHDVVSAQRDVRRAIGFVGQGNGAGHRQLGRDELISQGRAHGLSRADARRRKREERAEATERRDQGGSFGEGFSAELEESLRSLSAGEREVVALRIVLDLNSEETARLLGISPTAVSTRLSRALSKLEERMRDHDVVA